MRWDAPYFDSRAVIRMRLSFRSIVGRCLLTLHQDSDHAIKADSPMHFNGDNTANDDAYRG